MLVPHRPLLMEYSIFLIVGADSVFFEIVYLIFACECHVAGGSDDLYLRSENLECEIKTHLVVAGSG